ncbi:hypothetical protein CINS5915_04160 [Campylobacter insulaenigrae]|uniref:hypothetical protein n=1 Tax=Campylobacter insulaenigrae TaxID=260714 RepID=UPI002152A26B|nr:hypothetical protein [Campylobacter insulaenigrae]MCR6572086.1 hypothetical protein [Campylobacter insulaenigrae]MCR6573795.1 hypothetical protein [Campylobacter insulaenigrae]MCR6575557.1 hypothetical protein [Campylobacter insulaenigrae]MCR6576751.1 hypothetical protein [Campylobacter insulaenigrae]MCR6578113.1 hypothetical protein [Campylobacter insulaenigrae]
MYKIYTNNNNDLFCYFDIISNALEFIGIKNQICNKPLGKNYFIVDYNPKEILKEYERMMDDDNILACEFSSYDIMSQIEKIQYAPDVFIQNLKQEHIKHYFDGFNIAVYQSLSKAESSTQLAKTLRANVIDFERKYNSCGYSFLALNPQLAYKAASTVILDAYDSGSDFLVVENFYAFYMFDKCYKELQAVSGRNFEDFYILTFSELANLSLGIIPHTLKKHSLKVSLIE